MTSAFLNYQRGGYIVDKHFRSPKFKYVIAFSSADTYPSTLLISEPQFISNEIEELRGIVTSKWTGELNEFGISNAVTWTLNTTSGLPVSTVSNANTVGLYIFTGQGDIGQSWADVHSVTVTGSTVTFTVNNDTETNFDFTLFPNRMRIDGNDCSGTEYSYVTNVGTTDVTVLNVTNTPANGVYDMRGIGFSLMMVDENLDDITTVGKNVTFEVNVQKFEEVLY